MDALQYLHVYLCNHHWHWIAIGFLTYQINLGINVLLILKYHGNTNISTKNWKMHTKGINIHDISKLCTMVWISKYKEINTIELLNIWIYWFNVWFLETNEIFYWINPLKMNLTLQFKSLNLKAKCTIHPS